MQAPRWCHAHPLLRQLHCLPVHHRINYKLAVMTYKIHRTASPAYISQLSHQTSPIKTNITFISDSVARHTVHQDLVCATCLPMLSSICLSMSPQLAHQRNILLTDPNNIAAAPHTVTPVTYKNLAPIRVNYNTPT